MPTYPLATLACTIDENGISAPAYNDILQSLIASMQSIFGSDIYLPPDGQDYQQLAIFALAINDSNQATIAAYNGFEPTYAQGVNLSALVKINGITRESPTNSTALVTIAGVVGTTIDGGVVQDQNGNLWNLPASFVIPTSGAIEVTATCQVPGAIQALAGTITSIVTVVQGWQSVTNLAAATLGAPVETDAELRVRQAESTAISSITPLQSIIAAVADVAGVTRSQIYENDTNQYDENGIPPHSIAVVVSGGDNNAVALTIEEKKSPGTGTYGSTSVIVEDPAGLPVTINFFELVTVPIFVAVTIQPLNGYVSQDAIDLANAIAAEINSLPIGGDVFWFWLAGAAQQYGSAEGQTYVVKSMFIGIAANPTLTNDIPIPFNEAASGSSDNVAVTVL
jgi:uncharacterized phage protein gp47/JayE